MAQQRPQDTVQFYKESELDAEEDTEFAKCSFCRTQIPLEGLDSHTAEVLAALSRHLIPHIDKYSDILEEEVQELRSVDEAFIQSELEKEENMQLEINKKKQDIDKEVSMEKTLRSIETEDLKTLLQRYRMILNEETKELFCEIHKNYEHKYDANNQNLTYSQSYKHGHQALREIVEQIKMKRQEAATQISHPAERHEIQEKILKWNLNSDEIAVLPIQCDKSTSQYVFIHTLLHQHRTQHTMTPMSRTIKADENLQREVEELKKKKREAATQISHPAERYEIEEVHVVEPGQDIPSEGVPETQETPEAESSEIRSTATQSSATVENMPRQSSDDEDIPVSGETQSPLTVEPLSKQIRLDPVTKQSIRYLQYAISTSIDSAFVTTEEGFIKLKRST
ncbi:hypothetical protein G5I_11898 [Acromyrmex echinatior]|uniref:Uncharacterized protein n=1 Tax=Acromyrmex echinatior TaxID=103372 RepID=F4X0V4_ACREC|nr:hypothetical protein G5I_11898 [Acromyrmex echinatior]